MKRAREQVQGGAGLSRFLQYRFNTLILSWLPMRVGRGYLGLLGRIYYFFNQEEKQQIKRNLIAVIRRLPRTEPMDLTIRRTFRGIFAHYYEKLLTAYGRYDKVYRFLKKRVELESRQLLDEALSKGKGVILVTGHFGAVEFLPSILALNGYKVTMVVRFKTKRLKRALNRRAARLGITLLDASNGNGVIFTACQALKSNQILITECDEFEAWRPDRKRTTSFLGCTSPLDRTLDLLQRRYDSPVIMGLVCRASGNRYGLKLHSLNGVQHWPETESLSKRALEVLEWYIYLAPDQWYQWKQVRVALGDQLFKETRPIHAAEANRILSLADSALHAN
ncbi:MAG: lysophospholipid acyltransferase family protein [Deltaproteobacteria bacterium]|nr:MAG: lysophospholipid acyltransferase family protein [Deltaproteobacteria bacterium]